ncbi:MAG: FAD-dependent oxidoreductase [Anaerolineae bacterium]
MVNPGTVSEPLRVAIIGSGPAGFYAAERLQKEKRLVVEIDMFERLPTPFGLVRGGVAPDHQKIKSVTSLYDRIARKPGFRFYGNVEFGTDITHEDLLRFYHAIIYAVGAQSDRRLGIPGEDLPGSHSATEFVAWYNGHPDFRDREFDLSQESVAVIGVGNVALDVARVLLRTPEELARTDIADYALEALSNSNVRRVYVLGRRGPAQAAFTNAEIKELGEMEGAECIVDPEDLELDPLSKAYLESGADPVAVKNIQVLSVYARQPAGQKPRQLILRFLVSPVEILGTDRVEAIKVVRNELYAAEDGTLRPRPTGQYEEIPVGLVFRSVGYRGVPLPGVPFYDRWGVIPNDRGRVLTKHETGSQVIGEYVVGWIKRGPSGVIGTNRPDAIETVELLLEDLRAGRLLTPPEPSREAMEELLEERGIRYVTYEDWLVIDELERRAGKELGRPRLKFCSVEEMLEAVAEARQALSMKE